MRNGKAAGIDEIPPELWKDGGPALHSKLQEFLVCCCWQSKLPSDLRDAVIVTLYKNKGEKSDCSNYQRITLVSIAGKILARVFLNRLVPTIAEDHLPEIQCGFRANRGHHRPGVHPQTAPREMQGAEQRTVCSVCGPDQSVWHREQKGAVDDHGAPWLPPPLKSSGWLSNCTKTNAAQLVWTGPLWILSNHQRRETGLCSGTDSIQHLFHYDA